MSQFDFGTIDPFVVNGEQLADMLNDWRDAIHSWHRGNARPSYIVPGMMWVDDSAGATSWVVKVYLGATPGDVALFTYNTTTGAVSLSGSVDLLASLITASGTGTPSVAWNKTNNAADVKRWTMGVNGAGALVLSSLTDAGAVQFSITFNRDGTLSTKIVNPSFRVRATTGDTLSGPNLLDMFRTIATPVIDYDTSGGLTLGSPTLFVAPAAAKWAFDASIFCNVPATSTAVGVAIRHMNSANVVQRDYAFYTTAFNSGSGTGVLAHAEINMVAGDKIEFMWVVNSAVSVTLSAVSGGVLSGAALVYASGHKISD